MRTLSVVNKSRIFGKQNKEKKVTSKEIQILQGGNKNNIQFLRKLKDKTLTKTNVCFSYISQQLFKQFITCTCIYLFILDYGCNL